MSKRTQQTKATRVADSKGESEVLKGWAEIAKFPGQPISVAERWAKSGMPLRREVRHVTASPAELNKWLGRESAGEPVHNSAETNGPIG